MKNLFFYLMIVALAASSCQNLPGNRVRGNGNIKTLEHTVSAFKNVQVSGAVDLYLTTGSLKPVRIEADDNLQQYIDVAQEGNKVIIKFKDGVNLHPSHNIKAYISTPVYNTIDVSGVSNITGQGKIENAEKMMLQVSGAGDINMDIHAPAISAEVSGAGSVNLKGETKSYNLDLSGAASVHCYELLSKDTRVTISGAGSADVFASITLHAQVNGIGSVNYKGGAANVTKQVSGIGTVKKTD